MKNSRTNLRRTGELCKYPPPYIFISIIYFGGFFPRLVNRGSFRVPGLDLDSQSLKCLTPVNSVISLFQTSPLPTEYRLLSTAHRPLLPLCHPFGQHQPLCHTVPSGQSGFSGQAVRGTNVELPGAAGGCLKRRVASKGWMAYDCGKITRIQ